MFVVRRKDALEKLSLKNEMHPLSAYYYDGPGVPDEDTMKWIQFGKPLKESDCLHPEELEKLLEPGYMAHESGYCVFENGIGYAAAYTGMPGVSVKANNWWGPWHEQEDLRYKCWFPGAHFRVGPHWAQEDVGMGPEDLYMVERLTPQLAGIPDEKVKADKALVVMRISNWLCKPVNGPDNARPLPMVVIHDIRKTEDGIEYRSRFYIGMHFVKGRAKVMLPDGQKCPEERAYGMAYHCAHEMATLRKIVQPLYETYGPEI